MTARIIVLFIVLNFIYVYLNMPVFAFGFTDWSVPALLWGGFILLFPAVMLISRFRTFLDTTVLGQFLRKILGEIFPERQKVVDISDYQSTTAVLKRYKLLAVLGIVLVVAGVLNAFVLPIITSAPLFFSQQYRQLLGEVKESSFTADIEPINLAQIRIVDEETARKLAEKKIGEIPALGSEIQLGELSLQKVKGALYYVAPLEHRGIFQWLSNYRQGSRGFVMVSATNPQDVRLIQDVHIKYQTRALLFDYLPRYLYFHGYIQYGMTDFSFEIDDELHPYWVVTLYSKKIGYQGADAAAVLTVNAETGEISEYSLDNLPTWIDRVQPESFIYTQIKDWGEYVNGFWNSIFAKTGTLKPTSNELHLIYGNDDTVYWYTGITSLGRDGSTVGFILVNSRTKEARWYKVAGADEGSARKSAEGQVQEKGYRAGYPILYNIHGVPSYITPLKDKEGLLKSIAFVSVENYNLVGVGPDIESSLRSYQQSLMSKGNQFIPGNVVSTTTVRGVVSRISQVTRGGESYWYFTLEGDPRIFVGGAGISPKLPLAKVGDTVTVIFNETKEPTIPLAEFKGESY